MSGYRVIWPDEVTDFMEEVQPEILQFRIPDADQSFEKMDIITRARVLFSNRTCPSCHYPIVTPIELNDGKLNRNGLPIPGTATLVGFHCDSCHREWSV